MDKAKKLKQLGLIDFAIPRKGKEHHLTPAQKGQITKFANKHKSILNNPQGYAVRHVSKATAKTLDLAALKVKKGKRVTAFIPHEKNETVQILKNGVVKKSKGDYVKRIYPAGWNMLETADKIFKRKLRRGEYVMVQIGKNAPFMQTFTSKIQLLNYLQAWQPKDKNKTKEQLISHFALVTVRDPQYMDGDYEDEDESEFFEQVRKTHKREGAQSGSKKKTKGGAKNRRY